MRESSADPTIPIGSQQVSKGALDMDCKKSIKDDSSKIGGDWSGVSDKDKKPVSSVPKLDSTKFRNLGKVHYHGNCSVHLVEVCCILMYCSHSNLVPSSV